jgi:hypothetical protein
MWRRWTWRDYQEASVWALAAVLVAVSYRVFLHLIGVR